MSDLSPAWRHQSQVHGGATPCCESTAVGTLKGGGRPPETTSCLSSRAPWSPHLYSVGAGAAGCSELQTCLPSLLCFSALARCAGQGGDCRRARAAYPTSSSREPQGSGSWRGQGSWRGEKQPTLLVANLSLPGLSLGQRTLNPAGESSQGSRDPCLT